MSELGELFAKHATDKGLNGYTEMYEAILDPIRRLPLNILEIGIGTVIPDAPWGMHAWVGPEYRPGASLRIFRDYCPNATILGLDIQPDTQFTEERIATGMCNSADARDVARFFAWRRDEPFDLIVDDANHEPNAQLATFTNFHSRVRPGGHYVIEDIWHDSHVFHCWEEIAGYRFRPVKRLVNAIALRRVT